MAVNRYYSSNAIDTTLVTGIDSSETQIVLASTTGMPQSFPFTLALDYDTSSEELINIVGVGTVSNSYKVGAIVGTASVTGRGVDGNAATAHAAGAAVKHVISARDIREAQEHINATTKYTVTNGSTTYDVNLHGIASGEGAVVGTDKTQTLKNKAISSTDNTLSVDQADVVNLDTTLALKAPLASPTFTGTVVLPTGTVTSGMIADGTIVNADINASAGIDWTKLAISSTVSSTELGYLDGVTSLIQTQIDNLIPKATVTPFAGSSAPTGWLVCDGSSKSTTSNPEYAALYAVIGTTYGGTGASDFKLPDLRGRTPIGVGTGTGLSARTLASTVGAETLPAHAHSISHSHSASASTSVSGGDHAHGLNMWYSGTASHDHAISGASNPLPSMRSDGGGGDIGNYNGTAIAGSGNLSLSGSTSVSIGGTDTADSGSTGTGTHGVMQPSLALNYIIKY
jgi:microcystin-dependent protein